MPKCNDCRFLKNNGSHLECSEIPAKKGKWISKVDADKGNACDLFGPKMDQTPVPASSVWLPKNPYSEKISDDVSSTMVSNPKYNYFQEGLMVAAGNIFTRGNELCPHYDLRHNCAICWNNLPKEMGIKEKS